MPLDRIIAAMRPHFWTSLAAFVLMASVIVQESRETRFYTFVPVMFLYLATLAFYTMEHAAVKRIASAQKQDGEERKAEAAKRLASRPRIARPAPPHAHRDAIDFFKHKNALALQRA